MSPAGEPASSGYVFIDAGDGRRLERFGQIVVDRPAPAVEHAPRLDPTAWDSADARFDRPPSPRHAAPGSGADRGWSTRAGTPDAWSVTYAAFEFELRFASGGQVGLFPEHLDGARWLAEHVPASSEGTTLPVINLFAYTGLATVVLASHGIPVTHVDASRSASAWARRNASLNGLTEAAVRWIVDDAEAFVRRELRRGRTYGGVLLDPPTYGHGPRGEPWQFEDRIADLVSDCRRLLVPGGACLLTTHTPRVAAEQLASILSSAGVAARGRHGPLELRARSGAVLPLGAWARGTVG